MFIRDSLLLVKLCSAVWVRKLASSRINEITIFHDRMNTNGRVNKNPKGMNELHHKRITYG